MVSGYSVTWICSPSIIQYIFLAKIKVQYIYLACRRLTVEDRQIYLNSSLRILSDHPSRGFLFGLDDSRWIEAWLYYGLDSTLSECSYLDLSFDWISSQRNEELVLIDRNKGITIHNMALALASSITPGFFTCSAVRRWIIPKSEDRSINNNNNIEAIRLFPKRMIGCNANYNTNYTSIDN